MLNQRIEMRLPDDTMLIAEATEKSDYENLIIVHKYIHILIHATQRETIEQYLLLVGKENINIRKLNKLRLAVGNEVLTLDIY